MRGGYEPVSDDPSSPTLPRYQVNEKYGRRRRSRSKCISYILAIVVVILLTLLVAQSQGYEAKDIYVHVIGSSSDQGGRPDPVTGEKLSLDKPVKIVTPEAYTLSSVLAENAPITFIPYTFGYAMLKQTLKVYQRAQWKNIIIIDNSWHRDAWNDEEMLKELGVLRVVLTTTHMRFAQVMSTMDTLASSLGHEYYMWSHSDVFLVSPHSSPSPFDLVTTCISDRLSASKDLGVLYFRYDWLSMVRVEAANAAPWDPAMMQYGSDCDRYSRMRQAGYRAVESSEEGECAEMRTTLGEFFNMPGILSDEELAVVLSKEAPFEERLEAIWHANNNTDEYAWRGEGKGGMATVDSKAFDSYARGGHQYYEDKWGEGMGGDCVLDDKTPNFDIPPAPPRVVAPETNTEGKKEKDESNQLS